jgi:hypothetical protein
MGILRKIAQIFLKYLPPFLDKQGLLVALLGTDDVGGIGEVEPGEEGLEL